MIFGKARLSSASKQCQLSLYENTITAVRTFDISVLSSLSEREELSYRSRNSLSENSVMSKSAAYGCKVTLANTAQLNTFAFT